MEGNGYRTKQRELILKCLVDNCSKHLTADNIIEYLKGNDSAVGKTTVYRYLDKLVAEGIVRKYIVEEGKCACFQYSGESGECRQHFHLKCTVCNRLFHVECDYLNQLENHVFEHHKFRIDNTKTVLYGICGDCAEKGNG